MWPVSLADVIRMFQNHWVSLVVTFCPGTTGGQFWLPATMAGSWSLLPNRWKGSWWGKLCGWPGGASCGGAPTWLAVFADICIGLLIVSFYLILDTWRMQRIRVVFSSLIRIFIAHPHHPLLRMAVAHRRPPRPLLSRTTAKRSSMRPGTRCGTRGRRVWRGNPRPCPSTTTPSKPWTVWTRRTFRRREVTTKSVALT